MSSHLWIRNAPAAPLDAANVFLADVRDGLGPYLAICLLTEHCRADAVGGALDSLSDTAIWLVGVQ